MREAHWHSLLLIAAVASAIVVLAPTGADAQRQRTSRDAAIHNCVAKAQASDPRGMETVTSRRRVNVYKACMRAAGYRP